MTTAEIGHILISLGALLTAYVLIFSIVAIRTDRLAILRSVRNAIMLIAGFLTLAVFIMTVALFKSDFSLKYVFMHSTTAMPWLYKLAALWGGQSGSLLIWLWCLSLYCAAAVIYFWHRELRLLGYATAVMAAIELFFFLLVIYADDPFQPLTPVPDHGSGLNPLLQNILMLIHPPTMYIGLVGFTVPFAWAFAALIRAHTLAGSDDHEAYHWEREWRVWILIPWLFLGISNILGAAWAYVELGWGGFWAWDPVENASFMPWLLATPLLHTVKAHERHGGFKRWNLTLISLTFFLTIFGTFITRSGFIDSVHAFAQSSIGYYFLAFLSLLMIVSVTLLIKQNRHLRKANGPVVETPIFSRQSFLHYGNIVFLIAACVVCTGTLMPSLSSLLTGHKIAVTPSWFSRMMAPIGVLILVLTALTPLLGWKETKLASLKRALPIPVVVSVAAAYLCLALKAFQPTIILIASATALLLTFVVQDIVLGVAQNGRRARSPLKGIRKWALLKHRKIGGLLCHGGIGLMFLAFIGAAYQSETVVQLKPGEWTVIGEYRIQYQQLEFKNVDADVMAARSHLDVYRGKDKLGTLVPERRFYSSNPQPMAEAAILIRPTNDLYAILGNYDSRNALAEFKFTINPLISFLWLGGLALLIGTLIVLIPFKRLSEEEI